MKERDRAIMKSTALSFCMYVWSFNHHGVPSGTAKKKVVVTCTIKVQAKSFWKIEFDFVKSCRNFDGWYDKQGVLYIED